MSMPLYDIRDLRHAYGGRTVLRIDRLQVPPGGIIGITGPNGSGKSTLLRLVGFIEPPIRGEILFKGKPERPFSAGVRFRVTLLLQEPCLLKRSVIHNVAYGLRMRETRGDSKARVREALSWVGLPAEEFASRPWYALSGGEAQRVALAARLVLKPEVLLLDEPTAGVDAGSAQRIKDAALKAGKEWGTTLIIASHDWQWLYEICDRSYSMFRGRMLGPGPRNVLLGPWREFREGWWGKTLENGERLRLPPPPAPDAAAVIEDAALVPEGGEREPTPHLSALTGVVTRLSLEKASGEVMCSVLTGDLPLAVRLSQERVRESGLYPGRKVTVHYDPSKVSWLG